ncbi:MAG: acyl carrier protein [Dorea sp.]|jgi:acyl carrier protein|nr:acyl carrier protein [Dorea sp.]GFI43976.1 acyl carrier protein [Lachnospiraceae bacterium]
MTREEVYIKLLPVFKDVFDDRRIKLSDQTISTDIVGWDSLMHIQLIAAIQDEFTIEFGVEEAANFKNVGELVDLILKLI